MSQHISAVAFLVRDYDEAIAYFTEVVGLALVEDTAISDGKRWVLVAPRGTPGSRLLLARADGPEQSALVGGQGGGRVFLFLASDDFAGDYSAMRERGVRFLEEPRYEAYGTVAVFADLYGNRWDLIEFAR